MSAYDELARAINELVIAESEVRTIGDLAYLGFETDTGYAIAVKGHPNWLWVRIVRGETRAVDQAFNEIQVPRIPDLPVRVVPFGNHHKIVGYDISSISFLKGLQIGSREPGSGNVDIVSDRRIRPGLVHCHRDPTTGQYGMAVAIEAFTYRHNGRDKRYQGGLLNLATYLPETNKHCWVKIGLDPETNTAVAVAGPQHSTLVELEIAELDAISFENYIPLAGYPLRWDDSRIAAEGKFVSCRPWWSVGGDGTTGISLWNPDLPPSTPSSQDDEFSGSSLDAKWTEYDETNIQTYAQASGILTLSQPTQTGAVLTGVYQALPGGNFTIAAKVKLNTNMPSGDGQMWQAGIILWNNAANYNSQALIAGPAVERSSGVRRIGFASTRFQDNKTITTTYWDNYGGEWQGNVYVYVRLRRSGSTYYLDSSNDGLAWKSEQIFIPFTPNHVGLGLFNWASGQTITASFDFFRRRATFDGLDTPVFGALELGLAKLGNLGDVDLASDPPQNGEALVYSAASGLWKPGDGSPTAIHTDVSGEIAALTEKTQPGLNDWVIIEDAAAGNTKRKARLGNLPGGGGGGGLSGFTIWHPDAPPVNPSSYDDEFESETLAPRWNVDGSGNYSLSIGMLHLYGVHVYTGSIPSGNFAVWTKVSLTGIPYNFARGLLHIRSSLLNNSGVAYYIAIGYDSPSNFWILEIQRQLNGGYHSNPVQRYENVNFTALYLRIRYVNGTTSFDYSSDGLGWQRVYSVTDITPVSIALASTGDVNYMPTARFEFIRFSTSLVGLHDIMPGRLVTLPYA